MKVLQFLLFQVASPECLSLKKHTRFLVYITSIKSMRFLCTFVNFRLLDVVENRQVAIHIVYNRTAVLHKMIVTKVPSAFAIGGEELAQAIALEEIPLIFSLSFLLPCYKFDYHKQSTEYFSSPKSSTARRYSASSPPHTDPLYGKRIARPPMPPGF